MLRRLLDELLTSNRKDLETLEGLVQRQETGELPSWRIGSRARRGWCVASNWWKAAGASRMPASARTPSFAWVEECAVGVKLAILALDESLVEECTD